jgi:hypothetical protein
MQSASHLPESGLPHPASLTYAAFGVRVNVKANAALLRRVPSPLVAGASADTSGAPDVTFSLSDLRSPAGRVAYQLSRESETVAVSDTLEDALEALEKGVEEFVAERSKNYVFVHSGAVAWNGKAILIPGRTFSGKSTLVMELVRAGATYLSDEYAVLDRCGFVHSFARRPRLRQPLTAGGNEGASRLTFVNKPSASSPLPVGLVIRTSYDSTAVWRPQRMTPGETLLALVENAVAVRSQSEFTIAALRNVVVSARGLRTARSEASDAATNILGLVEKGFL